jgi:hypothetical protein
MMNVLYQYAYVFVNERNDVRLPGLSLSSKYLFIHFIWYQLKRHQNILQINIIYKAATEIKLIFFFKMHLWININA